MCEKRTLEEWSSFYGIEIVDPDGFDRTDLKLYERKFTEDEFVDGIPYCTVCWKGRV